MADESRRAEVTRRIKRIAREQIGEHGAAALSLARIARAMEMTTPALYRYFESRDELVTELVVDAYSELYDFTERALNGIDPSDLGGRFEAFCVAYREWALAHPEDYILIHGAVLPGYRAPVERLGAATFRVLSLFVELLAEAARLGKLRVPPDYKNLPEVLINALRPIEALPPELVTLAFLTWLQVHALVFQEVAGHLPAALFEDGGIFLLQMRIAGRQLGLYEDRAE
jgi:AcrR family transcriptional regulator